MLKSLGQHNRSPETKENIISLHQSSCSPFYHPSLSSHNSEDVRHSPSSSYSAPSSFDFWKRRRNERTFKRWHHMLQLLLAVLTRLRNKYVTPDEPCLDLMKN